MDELVEFHIDPLNYIHNYNVIYYNNWYNRDFQNMIKEIKSQQICDASDLVGYRRSLRLRPRALLADIDISNDNELDMFDHITKMFENEIAEILENEVAERFYSPIIFANIVWVGDALIPIPEDLSQADIDIPLDI